MKSERTPLYQHAAKDLLLTQHAYRCFCTSERLHQLASERAKLGLPTDYDRTCAEVPKDQSDERAANGESHVVRLRVPDRYPTFTDIIYGKLGKEDQKKHALMAAANAFDDPILLKSDGTPTYHLANVVDDHHMRITHVIRGTEWLSATPKHLALYNAFGWTPPQFAHVGLLVNEQGQKLSKRDLATDIASWKDRGVFPEALVNFVALLGWSHNVGSDFMSLSQLVENFSMRWTKGNATVSLGKLWFLQNKHAVRRVEEKAQGMEDMISAVRAALPTLNAFGAQQESRFESEMQWRAYIERILRADAKNYFTAKDFVRRNSYFFVAHSSASIELPPPGGADIDLATLDMAAKKLLQSLPRGWEWTAKGVHARIKEIVGEIAEGDEGRVRGASKTLHCYLRAVVVGGKEGPSIAETMGILGREVCEERIRGVRVDLKRAGEGEEGDDGEAEGQLPAGSLV
ncbi:hypothetical protein LTS18_011269 [Coniosporium uncinatum]|uniref:Uncharacterized protein n=1 Tax=Coniosporium uncinatum TaxID=93489 RepID=A0ACC3DWA9_9PEZI|nr:hypothetical protein LTS18_011269 [Coniosporium uncinatum]